MYFSYEAKTGRGGPGGGKGEEGVSQRDNKSVLSPATMEPGRREERKEGFKPRPTYPLPLPLPLSNGSCPKIGLIRGEESPGGFLSVGYS